MCVDNFAKFFGSFFIYPQLNRAVSEFLQEILNIAQQCLLISNMPMPQIPFNFFLSHLLQCNLSENILSLNNSVFTVLIQNFLETASSKSFLNCLSILCAAIENRKSLLGLDIGLEENSPHIISSLLCQGVLFCFSYGHNLQNGGNCMFL